MNLNEAAARLRILYHQYWYWCITLTNWFLKLNKFSFLLFTLHLQMKLNRNVFFFILSRSLCCCCCCCSVRALLQFSYFFLLLFLLVLLKHEPDGWTIWKTHIFIFLFFFFYCGWCTFNYNLVGNKCFPFGRFISSFQKPLQATFYVFRLSLLLHKCLPFRYIIQLDLFDVIVVAVDIRMHHSTYTLGSLISCITFTLYIRKHKQLIRCCLSWICCCFFFAFFWFCVICFVIYFSVVRFIIILFWEMNEWMNELNWIDERKSEYKEVVVFFYFENLNLNFLFFLNSFFLLLFEMELSSS